jgi:hypothetical protein
MTTTYQSTLQTELDRSSPQTLADALKKVGIGAILAAIATETTDALAVASNVVTLTKAPLPGTLRITLTYDGGVAIPLQEQLPGTSAIVAGHYKLSGTGNKTVTFKTGDYADATTVKAQYISKDDFPTAAELSAAWANE